jgi:hypothetical protein
VQLTLGHRQHMPHSSQLVDLCFGSREQLRGIHGGDF